MESFTNRPDLPQENSISIDETPHNHDQSQNNLEARFECPICLNWLQDPMLTLCGHRFCKHCITSWLQREGGCCPIDNKPIRIESDLFPDHFTRREILQIRTPCHFRNLGCGASLSPLELDAHMAICPYKATESNGLDVHKDCSFKPLGCSFGTMSDIELGRHLNINMQQHLNLLLSAYKESNLTFTSYNLKASEASSLWDATKNKETCEWPDQNGSPDKNKNLILAMYERIVVLEQKNREQETELKNLAQKIVNTHVKNNLQVQALLETRYCNGVHVWKVEQFKLKLEEMKNDSSVMFYSRGVYTSPYGYGFCARINVSPKEPNCLALHIHMMRTDNDSTLTWPFSGRINLILVHPVDSRKSQYDTIMSRPEVVAFQRPVCDISPRGFGFLNYTNLETIGQYIVNDLLLIKMELRTV